MEKELENLAELAAADANLIYVNNRTKGYHREKNGKGFIYTDDKGKKVSDDNLLDRFKKLVIPPAYTDVWICASKKGHIQFTGIDVAGRKQYRYHAEWNSKRNETKFGKLLKFGLSLPLIRKKIKKDLGKRELEKDKVVAIALSLLDKSFIRIGNAQYEKKHGSYGLTTLKDKHVKATSTKLRIKFKGKKGVEQDIEISDSRLAKLVKKCRDIPGQELFQYYQPNGERCPIDSGNINKYLREASGEEFTAKDFRTWAGSTIALSYLANQPQPEKETLRKKIIVEAVDKVASKLGNTRSVCKKYYIYPTVLDRFLDGKSDSFLNQKNRYKAKTTDFLNADEKFLMAFLKKFS